VIVDSLVEAGAIGSHVGSRQDVTLPGFDTHRAAAGEGGAAECQEEEDI
jgi:hypothetical protein